MKTTKEHCSYEVLSEYLEEDLTREEMDTVGKHLVCCKDCQNSLQRLQDLKAAARALPQAELPAGIMSRLFQKLDIS